MYRFHIAIHARAKQVVPGSVLTCGVLRCPTLAVEPQLLAEPFAISFEQAAENLHRLPRMFVEPDGSFVWVSDTPEHAWQVDGNLFDRRERLLYVEAKGSCPAPAFDRLLAACGWPETTLIFQLIRQAVFLEEAEFRRFAERPLAYD